MYQYMYMCGESWLAIKDSLTHHPSSQGWALILVSSSAYVLQLVTSVHVYTWLDVYSFVWVAFLPYLLCISMYMNMPSLPRNLK